MSTLEATRTETETKSSFIEEMVTWIKILKEAGVSADKAAEVSKDIMIELLSSCPAYADDEDEEEYEDEDYEEE